MSTQIDASGEKQTPTHGQKVFGIFSLLFCVGTGLFHLYYSGYGHMSATILRAVHLALMLTVVFLFRGGKGRNLVSRILDVVLALAVLGISGYYIHIWLQRMSAGSFTGFVIPNSADIITGILMILIILEATRRTTGYTLVIVVILFLLYALFGSELPGFLGHKQYSLSRIVGFLYLTNEGIYGTPIAISSSFIVLFVIFGAILEQTGGGQAFIDLGFGLTGRFRGGSAKTSVVSSALFGSISGSPVANVVTTGAFTIPLMKRSGFPAHVAGAVEAVASTGGLILPPVMGSAAFLMAEYLGITYQKVAIAALLPAILYYACAFFMADLSAVRYGVLGHSKSELPRIPEILKRDWFTLIPLGVLIYLLLILGRSPTYSAYWSIVIAIVLSQLAAVIRRRVPIRQLLAGIKSGVIGSTSVVAACASAGIIMGVVSITGLGPRFASIVIYLSGRSLLVAAFLTMIISIVLGTGLPAVAVYVLTAVLCTPALISLGVSPIAAHMFVFYFSIVSSLTPPVALAAYAAAGISGSSINKTGFTAFKMAIVAYFVPYFFLYSPLLLMKGPWHLIVLNMVLAILGTGVISIAVTGVLKTERLRIWERIVVFVGGFLLAFPEFWLALPGTALTAIGLGSYLHRARGTTKATETA